MQVILVLKLVSDRFTRTKVVRLLRTFAMANDAVALDRVKASCGGGAAISIGLLSEQRGFVRIAPAC